MRFRFRLQKVLGFIGLKERLKKLELAKALGDLLALEGEKSRLEAQLRELLASSTKKMANGAGEAAYALGQVELDAGEIKRLEQRVRKQRALVDEIREELYGIARRRSALEALRERRLAEHKRIENRREQKSLDEAFRLARADRK